MVSNTSKIAIVISYGSIASFVVGCLCSIPTMVAVSTVIGTMSFVTAIVADV